MHKYKESKAAGNTKLEAQHRGGSKANARIMVCSKHFDPTNGDDLGFNDNGPAYDLDTIDGQIAALTGQIEDLQELRVDVEKELKKIPEDVAEVEEE